MKFLRGLLDTGWAMSGLTAWVLIAFVKMFAVAAYLESAFGFNEDVGFVFGFFVSLVPVLGGVFAFLGASGVWDWAWPIAGFLFLVGPLTTALAVFTGRGRAGSPV